MAKSLYLTNLFLLLTTYAFAQCAADEVEIKVEIATDNWGYETAWTLTNLAGDILLQGGQDGVYDNNAFYADSICVATGGCYFFEIYDTYGDGIYTPNGYTLYVDEAQVASGADDIQSYAIENVYCPAPCALTLEALNDLQAHVSGTAPLDNDELALIRNVFFQFPTCLVESEAMLLLSKSVVEAYDATVGPLFTTPATANGFSKNMNATPALATEHAMIALQQSIFDIAFTPDVYAGYPQHLNGWIFNSCNSFPGYVAPPADSSISHTVTIRANFADPAGTNPYLEINNDGTDHALRPTGLYLAPGSVASITVPESLVGQEFYVRVGSHEWDLGIRPIYRRMDRISKKFSIDATTIEVYNPLGGAISILVPYGADAGIVDISISNGLECPFFSLKSFYETTDFAAELEKPGPWAVFETDNVMFTIPTHSIGPGQYDLRQAMLDWDAAIRGVNSVMARAIVSDKHDMYMIADITIRHNVYSIGYPMSNTPLNFTSVPGPAYFIDGPGGEGDAPDSNDETNFHEHGHALAMTKFPGEVEALVNVPYIMAMHHGLGQDLNVAVKNSFPPFTFEIDETATHRMVSNSFGTQRDITNSTTNEVRYQHRGYGHYFEIVNMWDWCPLRNFWRQEFIDAENGIDYGINNQDSDLRTLRMSVAAQADLRPLFHVFGILPEDAEALADTLAQSGIEPSLTVYNRLQDYFALIPADNAAFVAYALSVYPNLYTDGPTQNPDFGVGWHYQKSLTYDAAEAQERTNTLQSIIDLYFPDGAPAGGGDIDVCCTLDPPVLNVENGEINATGGVLPYTLMTDTVGNTEIITLTDFDGCISTVASIINSVTEAAPERISIYPNPSSTAIHIAWTGEEASPIERVSLLALNGQVVRTYGNLDRAIDVSAVKSGTYLLQIELAGGTRVHRRVVVLR